MDNPALSVTFSTTTPTPTPAATVTPQAQTTFVSTTTDSATLTPSTRPAQVTPNSDPNNLSPVSKKNVSIPAHSAADVLGPVSQYPAVLDTKADVSNQSLESISHNQNILPMGNGFFGDSFGQHSNEPAFTGTRTSQLHATDKTNSQSNSDFISNPMTDFQQHPTGFDAPFSGFQQSETQFDGFNQGPNLPAEGFETELQVPTDGFGSIANIHNTNFRPAISPTTDSLSQGGINNADSFGNVHNEGFGQHSPIDKLGQQFDTLTHMFQPQSNIGNIGNARNTPQHMDPQIPETKTDGLAQETQTNKGGFELIPNTFTNRIGQSPNTLTDGLKSGMQTSVVKPGPNTFTDGTDLHTNSSNGGFESTPNQLSKAALKMETHEGFGETNQGFNTGSNHINKGFGDNLNTVNSGMSMEPNPHSGGFESNQNPFTDGFSSGSNSLKDGFRSEPNTFDRGLNSRAGMNDRVRSQPDTHFDGLNTATVPTNEGFGSNPNIVNGQINTEPFTTAPSNEGLIIGSNIQTNRFGSNQNLISDGNNTGISKNGLGLKTDTLNDGFNVEASIHTITSSQNEGFNLDNSSKPDELSSKTYIAPTGLTSIPKNLTGRLELRPTTGPETVELGQNSTNGFKPTQNLTTDELMSHQLSSADASNEIVAQKLNILTNSSKTPTEVHNKITVPFPNSPTADGKPRQILTDGFAHQVQNEGFGHQFTDQSDGFGQPPSMDGNIPQTVTNEVSQPIPYDGSEQQSQFPTGSFGNTHQTFTDGFAQPIPYDGSDQQSQTSFDGFGQSLPVDGKSSQTSTDRFTQLKPYNGSDIHNQAPSDGFGQTLSADGKNSQTPDSFAQPLPYDGFEQQNLSPLDGLGQSSSKPMDGFRNSPILSPSNRPTVHVISPVSEYEPNSLPNSESFANEPNFGLNSQFGHHPFPSVSGFEQQLSASADRFSHQNLKPDGFTQHQSEGFGAPVTGPSEGFVDQTNPQSVGSFAQSHGMPTEPPLPHDGFGVVNEGFGESTHMQRGSFREAVPIDGFESHLNQPTDRFVAHPTAPLGNFGQEPSQATNGFGQSIDGFGQQQHLPVDSLAHAFNTPSDGPSNNHNSPFNGFGSPNANAPVDGFGDHSTLSDSFGQHLNSQNDGFGHSGNMGPSRFGQHFDTFSTETSSTTTDFGLDSTTTAVPPHRVTGFSKLLNTTKNGFHFPPFSTHNFSRSSAGTNKGFLNNPTNTIPQTFNTRHEITMPMHRQPYSTTVRTPVLNRERFFDQSHFSNTDGFADTHSPNEIGNRANTIRDKRILLPASLVHSNGLMTSNNISGLTSAILGLGNRLNNANNTRSNLLLLKPELLTGHGSIKKGANDTTAVPLNDILSNITDALSTLMTLKDHVFNKTTPTESPVANTNIHSEIHSVLAISPDFKDQHILEETTTTQTTTSEVTASSPQSPSLIHKWRQEIIGMIRAMSNESSSTTVRGNDLASTTAQNETPKDDHSSHGQFSENRPTVKINVMSEHGFSAQVQVNVDRGQRNSVAW